MPCLLDIRNCDIKDYYFDVLKQSNQSVRATYRITITTKQRVLTPGHQGWNDLHSLCRIAMEYYLLNNNNNDNNDHNNNIMMMMIMIMIIIIMIIIRMMTMMIIGTTTILGRELGPSGVSPNQNSWWKLALAKCLTWLAITISAELE